jgi:D-alanyl-D-alanine carboxypeptidase/D-alanyl-D-alanine endopeptidase (penicillin-binding protein 7)
LLIEEDTGRILLEKDANAAVPIASLTKLMTAMVVLDTKPDMNARVVITSQDVDTIKHTSSRIPVGAVLPMKTVLKLALVSSDNRAAAALARTYPGGPGAFAMAVRAKLKALHMAHTVIVEPTGLSSYNTSTAMDLSKMVRAAAGYPEINRLTTDREGAFTVNGHAVRYRNTNRLLGQKGWKILLSKTGFTSKAGKCLVMRVKTNNKNVIMVLLNAKASNTRIADAAKLRRLLEESRST